jgi:hypothetical protein
LIWPSLLSPLIWPSLLSPLIWPSLLSPYRIIAPKDF